MQPNSMASAPAKLRQKTLNPSGLSALAADYIKCFAGSFASGDIGNEQPVQTLLSCLNRRVHNEVKQIAAFAMLFADPRRGV